MSNKASLQACLKLCSEMLARNYRPEVKQVVLDYQDFFKNHQALLDAISLDPSNVKGRVTAVQGKIIEDFNKKCDKEDTAGRFKPILIKELIPGDAFRGLAILEEGCRDALEGMKIYYYSISLSIPWERLPRFVNSIRFKVVNNIAEAERLEADSLEQRKRELEHISKAK